MLASNRLDNVVMRTLSARRGAPGATSTRVATSEKRCSDPSHRHAGGPEPLQGDLGETDDCLRSHSSRPIGIPVALFYCSHGQASPIVSSPIS
jgi:hypothetical protein